MKVTSVRCASPDAHLHLAPCETGRGFSLHTLTLCLEPWTKDEPARTDSKFCPICFQKWHDSNSKEHNNG